MADNQHIHAGCPLDNQHFEPHFLPCIVLSISISKIRLSISAKNKYYVPEWQLLFHWELNLKHYLTLKYISDNMRNWHTQCFGVVIAELWLHFRDIVQEISASRLVYGEATYCFKQGGCEFKSQTTGKRPNTSTTDCTCTGCKSMRMPCKHMLSARKQSALFLFAPELVWTWTVDYTLLQKCRAQNKAISPVRYM